MKPSNPSFLSLRGSSLAAWLCWVLFVAVIAVAAWFRLHGLNTPPDTPVETSLYRPMHIDEAVQALKLKELMEDGHYVYDPKDFHGPVLLYSTLPIAWLRGQRALVEVDEYTLRLVPVIYGLASLILLTWARRALSFPAMIMSAAMIAISPAFVYYSRYYIMETAMVFFITLAMIALWRYSSKPGMGWALLFGAAGGLTHATKETGAISFLAIAIASGVVWRLHRKEYPAWRWSHVLASAGFGLAVSAVCFGAAGGSWRGARDNVWNSLATYFNYAHRAGGAGHEKPWDYYLKLLWRNQQDGVGPVWSEAMILCLGALGAIVSFTPWAKRVGDHRGYRFLAIYTIACAAIYSFIPYKTPWSMLCWLFTLALLGALPIALLFQLRGRYTLIALLAGAAFVCGLNNSRRQSNLSLFPYQANTRNPYVYGHTSGSLLQVTRLVKSLSAIHPQGRSMPVAIYQEDWGWPLPWYFRDLKQMRLSDKAPPHWEPAPVVIASYNYDGLIEPRLKDTHEFALLCGIREGLQLVVYVEKSLWAKHLGP